jgi:hypothetical protein
MPHFMRLTIANWFKVKNVYSGSFADQAQHLSPRVMLVVRNIRQSLGAPCSAPLTAPRPRAAAYNLTIAERIAIRCSASATTPYLPTASQTLPSGTRQHVCRCALLTLHLQFRCLPRDRYLALGWSLSPTTSRGLSRMSRSDQTSKCGQRCQPRSVCIFSVTSSRKEWCDAPECPNRGMPCASMASCEVISTLAPFTATSLRKLS